MSTADRPADITVQIWPETALPLALANDADGRAAVAAAIPKSGVLLTGSVRFPEGTRAEREARNRFLARSEEHTSEPQSLMRISHAVICLKTKKNNKHATIHNNYT